MLLSPFIDACKTKPFTLACKCIPHLDAHALHIHLDNVAVVAEVDELFKLVLHCIPVKDVKGATLSVDIHQESVKLLALLKRPHLVLLEGTREWMERAVGEGDREMD